MTFWGNQPRDNIRRLDLILETDRLVGKRAPIEPTKGRHKADVDVICDESDPKKDKKIEQLELF
jgi:hypothetical protein